MEKIDRLRYGTWLAVLVASAFVEFVGSWADPPEILAQTGQHFSAPRAVLDAAGGSMVDSQGFRLRSSSAGSWVQTGRTSARFNIRGGFVQPVLAPSSGVTPLPGDFNQDRIVDFSDFFLFAEAFGSRDVRYDLSRDGRVDFEDFFLFAAQFGKRL